MKYIIFKVLLSSIVTRFIRSTFCYNMNLPYILPIWKQNFVRENWELIKPEKYKISLLENFFSVLNCKNANPDLRLWKNFQIHSEVSIHLIPKSHQKINFLKRRKSICELFEVSAIQVRLILCANFELGELKFWKKLLSQIVGFHELYYL